MDEGSNLTDFQETNSQFSDLLDFEFSHHLLHEDTDLTDIKFELQLEPPSTHGPPPRGDFAGDFNFEVGLSGENTNRKKYVYSHQLNRVYLCMMTEMALQFHWDWDKLLDHELWIRATTILSQNQHQETRVVRCYNHRVTSDFSNRDVPPHVIPHVLRSASQGPDVFYCGKDENDRSWLSVALKTPSRPPQGVSALQHVYFFCCKHSCISGINRRPIEVIFTLEDMSGEVLGRRSMGVRVCSCPRRDMEKDEAEFCQNEGPPAKKRLSQNNTQPQQSTTDQPLDEDTLNYLRLTSDLTSFMLRRCPNGNPLKRMSQEMAQEVKRQINAFQGSN